eukprot:CAMPEP_0118663466 /NCGR_PEP_ID=MMETSP0785-20121206/17444_1 /TAXON_ID=91992 /ORGANISM="Bolidomonas pacifica, Strain CCMP 1866" /LENGTH=196 /DNA_ID=CAMNT_0006557207 /DNA_START=122 /DNA_END=709 /DNA_ORIENTATION=+
MSSIHVCQAGSCRRAGSEAVLVEIEELASAIDDQCDVRRSGCLGLCSRAPAAVIVEESGEEIVHTRIQSLEESANVVTSATGRKSPLEDPAIQARLAGVRAMRLREHAIKTFRWNGALKAVGDEIVSKRSKDGRKARVGHLVSQAKELIKKAAMMVRPLTRCLRLLKLILSGTWNELQRFRSTAPSFTSNRMTASE